MLCLYERLLKTEGIQVFCEGVYLDDWNRVGWHSEIVLRTGAGVKIC